MKEVEEISEYDQKIVSILCQENELNVKEVNVERELCEHSTKNVKIRLPKISLKKFNGNPVEFMSFREQFFSSVHKNNDLSEIEKFVYLKSLLGEKAMNVIKGLTLTEGNYNSAIELLDSRFGNKQVIINSHIENLANLPTVTSSSNVNDLRKLYDKIESNLRSLQTLGVNSNSYGTLLVPVLLSRIPDELKILLSRTMTSENDTWSIDELLKILDGEIKARERCTTSLEERRSNSTAHALNISEVQGCVYCDGRHKSSSCRKIKSPEERKKFLAKNRRCFVCLKQNHRAVSCKTNKKCEQCKGKHHTSIHGAPRFLKKANEN